MRISFNINGNSIRDTNYLIGILKNIRPNSVLLSGNTNIANDIYETLSGDKILILKKIVEKNEKYWESISPNDYVAKISDWGKAHKSQAYFLGVDSYTGSYQQSQISKMLNWWIDVMEISFSNGYKLAIGDFTSMNTIMESDIKSGIWDRFINAMIHYKSWHILAVQEYTTAILPYPISSKNSNQHYTILDKNKNRPDLWKTEYVPKITNDEYPEIDNIYRTAYINLRCDEIKTGRLPFVVTHAAWGYDKTQNRDGSLDKLRSKYNTKLSGINSYNSIWNDYYPFWSHAKSAIQQLHWLDNNVYPDECRGLMLYSWDSLWENNENDLSDPKLLEFHKLLIEYSTGNIKREYGKINVDEDSPTIPMPLYYGTIEDTKKEQIDLAEYMFGDGIVYEMLCQSNDSVTITMTTKKDNHRIYYLKSSSGSITNDWGDYWYDDTYVWHNINTDMSDNVYKQSFDKTNNPYQHGSKFFYRSAKPGIQFFNAPEVSHYNMTNCTKVKDKPSATFPYWVELKAVYKFYELPTGEILPDVIEIWLYLHDPIRNKAGLNYERRWYAKRYGMVGWQDTTKEWNSFYTKDTNENANNKRMLQIPCLVLPEIKMNNVPTKYPDDSHAGWGEYGITPTNNYANMRYNNDTKSDIISQINEHVNAQINTTAYVKQIDGIWFPIKYKDHKGWIRSDTIKITDMKTKTTEQYIITYNPNNEKHRNIMEIVKKLNDMLLSG